MALQTWERERNALALLDEEFLAALLEQKERELYGRIASLDVNELPIEYIEGRVTGGSINVDGNSAVRRSCSLTMVSDDVNINDVYWGVRTKFKLEVGVKNRLVNEYRASDGGVYPDIIWFPQGVFLITAFNTSLSTNSCTISLQGKDKMCQLNGDLSGQLFASIDFGQEETENKIFKEVKTNFTSSEQFMARQYYIKPDNNPAGLLTSIGVSWDGNTYGFSVDANGTYYREGSYYKLIPQDSAWSRNVKVKYQIYKLVENPTELFVQTTAQYSPNTYFYQKKFFNDADDTGSYYLCNENSAPAVYYTTRTLYEVDYEYSIKKIPIEKIIRESVHTYAHEPYHNIIINDLDKYGLEQLSYKGDTTMYAFRRMSDGCFSQLAMLERSPALKSFLASHPNFVFDTLSYIAGSVYPGTKVHIENNDSIIDWDSTLHGLQDPNGYTIAKIEYGQDIGYRITDLTYAGDLVSNFGDTLTSVLDKLKTMLGDFEYFYDVEGHFVFQRKPIYVNVSFSQLTDNGDETYVTYGNDKKKFSFNFEGNRLISAVQNNPQLNNVKNDYAVWGKRTTLSGAEVPIHVRYAIDKKPSVYVSLRGYTYMTQEEYDNPSYEELAEVVNHNPPVNNGYTKNTAIIPTFLKESSDKWWELRDWAEYYKTITGAYPSQQLLEYGGKQGFIGTLTFPNGTSRTFSGQGQLIIDLDSQNNYNPLFRRIDASGQTISWGPFQHGFNGCYHTYAEFLSFYNYDSKFISFIYDPVLPSQQVIEQDQIQAGVEPSSQWLIVQNSEIKIVDWREIIYQMALDYFAGQGCSEDSPILDKDGALVLSDPDWFLAEVGSRNPYYYPTGYTGYEQYYTDMEGFWRQLYNPDYIPQAVYEPGNYNITRTGVNSNGVYYQQKAWNERAIVDYNIQYYFDYSNPIIAQQYNNYVNLPSVSDEIKNKYVQYMYRSGIDGQTNTINNERKYWNIDVFENPENLNFWIEFLDDDYELAQFSVPSIGIKSKTVNDDKITAIVFKEIPDLILVSNSADLDSTNRVTYDNLHAEITDQSGYTFVYLPKGLAQYFTISYRNLSAKNKVDQLLYQFGYCIENISITALPIYHLQPNTRIYVHDDTTKINGEYIVNRLSIPLAYNGTMSINASKAPERLY